MKAIFRWMRTAAQTGPTASSADLLELTENSNDREQLAATGDLCRRIITATPAGHPDRAAILSNLGTALWASIRRSGCATVDDLDDAIAYLREALHAGHPSRAELLSDLGTALWARFDHGNALEDLDASIQANRQAVQATAADHPRRTILLSNLGMELRVRAEFNETEEDLNAAVACLRESAQITRGDDTGRGVALSSLGRALLLRFERDGSAEDLDAAIETGQQAVQATPANYPARAVILSELVHTLRVRFERNGAAEDLDAAIETGQQAVQATPANYPDRAGVLSSVGSALRARFERSEAAEDLDAAISDLREAVQATSANHPARGSHLANLGSALRVRFVHSGVEEDLDAAIEAGQEAVQVTPANDPTRAVVVSELANALITRAERGETAEDLDAAISHLREAVQATPANRPNRAVHLSNLGIALRMRAKRSGVTEDLEAAYQTYAEAASADSAAPRSRIAAGHAAAKLVAEADPARAASLLEAAVLLLPEITPRFLHRGDQQHAIARFTWLAADSAALSLSSPAIPEPDRPVQALRLLEAARGILLGQALSMRGDLSELRQSHPELAARFVELRDWLDRPSPLPGTDPENLPVDSRQHRIQDRRQTYAEFTRLLAHIRSLAGFAAFALPPATEQLRAQADRGPVVVFNVSVYRSDAILLTKDGITSQRLPGLRQADVMDQINVFHQALFAIPNAETPQNRIRAQETILQVLAWLWDNATGPVLSALGYHEPPAPGEPWPRLWWVPGGLLSLLPIHAAGYHTNPPDPGHRAVMDRVISSYSPTIGALAHARAAHATEAPGEGIRSLIVAMPATPDLPGEGRLTFVSDEAAMLQRRLPCPTMLTEVPGADKAIVSQLPTKAAVLEHLAGCTIAHFACHGYIDPADPSKSRLLLHDHSRNPLTVAELATAALDHAKLAYLSACGTALMANTRLLDEAIHLASAFQMAGFPHVIGTLWEINDRAAARIAESFYAALANPDGTLDPLRAADALHHATRTLRAQQPTAPYLWASHIHTGA